MFRMSGKGSSGIANDKEYLVKEQILLWLFSIAASVFFYLCILFVVHFLYHPDPAFIAKAAHKIVYKGPIHPEPVESLRFRLGIATLIPSFLVFYILFSKLAFLKGLAASRFYEAITIITIIFLAILIYAGFAAHNPYSTTWSERPQNARDYYCKTNFEFFFRGLFLGRYLILYTLVIVPFISILFFRRKQIKDFAILSRFMERAGYLAIMVLVLSIVTMNTYRIPYTLDGKYDFNAVYYAMTQVYAGTPMLVNGFSNTYGLYPVFLNPLFQLFGLSVLKFSLVMAVLTGFSFVLNFYFLKKWVRNKYILFAGFCTTIFFPYLNSRLITPFDSFFAFYPIRYILPSVLLVLASSYFITKSKAVYWWTTLLLSIFVLWNPEFGLVCLVAWILASSFSEFENPDRKLAAQRSILHLFQVAIVSCMVIFLFGCYSYLFYGHWPDFRLLFSFIWLFGKLGYGLLPMPLIHPWNFEVLILFLGFAYATVKWYQREVTPRVTIVFLVSLVGLGSFFYYQGRSHNLVFSSSAGFSCLLLTLLGDELWQKVKANSLLFLRSLFVLFLFIVSVSFCEIAYCSGYLYKLVFQENLKARQQKLEDDLNRNEAFVLANSRVGEKILILTAEQNEGFYYNGNKRVSAFNPGSIVMFLSSDLDRLERTVIDSSFSIFVEPAFFKMPYAPRLYSAISASYQLVATNGSMVLLRKRDRAIKMETAIQDSFALFHKSYDQNTSPITRIIALDSIEIDKALRQPSCALEVSFNSKLRIYDSLSLFTDDSDNIKLADLTGNKNYWFGQKQKRVVLSVPAHENTTLKIDFTPGRANVYQDGKLIYERALSIDERSIGHLFGSGKPTVPGNWGGVTDVVVYGQNPKTGKDD